MQIVFLVEDEMTSCSLAYFSGKQDGPKQVQLQFPGEGA